MEILTSAVLCLALNIYNEARGEPLRGQYAVAQVTMNRMADRRWPNEICAVVYQPEQFSWTLKRFTIRESKDLDLAIDIAREVLEGRDQPVIECADHYHNHTVRPTWIRDMDIEVVIGNHIFYCSE